MLIFIAIVFCLAFLAFIFTVIVPSLLNLIQKISGKKVSLNIGIGLYIFVITFVVSLWIYAQLVLIISGDIEQVKYNVASLIPKIEEEKRSTKFENTEEQLGKEEVKNDMNTQIYQQLKPTTLLSRYEGCLETYKWLEGEPSYQASSSFYECKRTEKFCLAIGSLYDVNDEYKEELVGDKALCKQFGWYGSSNRYSKDFSLN
ncbi:hypothetical protein NIES25_29370 [Nostoc linckia NIES-25]|nr:hypothetical protein NIES25_29370 [Nostoc linckia NIES-25]